jgi:hypothetical protein
MLKKETYHQLLFDFLYAPFHRIYQRVRMKKDGFKTYFNAQHLLLELTSQERGFLDYMIENADTENRLFVDVDFKNQYCVFLRQKLHLKTVPTINKLDKTLKKFADLGLVVKEKGKNAYYRINPKYFWKGSESSRVQTIRNLVISRIRAKLPFACLIDMPEDEFLKNMAK